MAATTREVDFRFAHLAGRIWSGETMTRAGDAIRSDYMLCKGAQLHGMQAMMLLAASEALVDDVEEAMLFVARAQVHATIAQMLQIGRL